MSSSEETAAPRTSALGDAGKAGGTDWAAKWDVTRAEMKAEADPVRADMRRFISHHLIANLFLHALNSANESGAWDFPLVEYAGLARWHDGADDPGAVAPTGEDVDRIARAIGRLFFTVDRFYSTQAKEAGEHHDRAEIAHRLRSAGLRIRVRAYQVHEERVLRGLFGPFAARLKSTLGFEVEDLIRCFDAIPTTIEAGLVRFRAAYTGVGNPESIDEHHKGAGDYLSFNAAALAGEASLPTNVIEAILSTFSLKRGEPDAFALEPSPFSILRQKPVLALGDGRYLLPTQALLFPAVQSRLEELLNPNVTPGAAKGLWSRYVHDRGVWVEQEAFRLLERMMPHGRGIRGAYYDAVDDGRRVEGDVVYQVDDAVFLVEGKAGAFSPPSLRGAPGRLDSDVADIITEGHDQAARTEAYLLSGGREFLDKHGNVAFTLTGKIREIIRIVVTLDTVGALSTAAAAMHRAGYMTGDPSWVVSLTNLMIIAEGMAVPGEFRHFVRRRYSALLGERVLVWDEIDHLGIYQVHNEMDLAFPGQEIGLADESVAPDNDAIPPGGHTIELDEPATGGEGDTIVPFGYTDGHDAFYVRGEGDRPPHQDLPDVFEQIVRALGARHDALWTQAVCDLLDFGNDSRQKFSESIAERMALGFERPRSVTVGGGDGDWSVTVIVMPGAHLTILMERFLSALVAAGRPSTGKVRLMIAWDPTAGLATADYFHLAGDRYMRVPPGLVWKSAITNR